MVPAKHGATRLLRAGLLIFCWHTLAASGVTWSARAWQSDDGLPNNRVTSLAQTSDGYLWIATPTRLARFDGDRFETISRETFAPGANERTSKLLRSRDGGLWLAMDHGPVIYARDGATHFFTNGLPDENVQTLTEETGGGLWITYRGGAICRLKDGKVTRFATEDGLPGWTLCSLARDARGRLWFAQGGSIGVFENEQFHSLFSIAEQTIVIRLAPAHDGGLWACAGTELFKLDGTGDPRKVGEYHPAMPDAQVTALFEDSRGGVWIGTSDSGLFHFDSARFEEAPISHREILCLMEDREGSVWAGTGGGLNQIRPQVVSLENAASGLPFESLRSVCEDSNGTLWAVTQNGLLVRRSNGAWSSLGPDAGWPGGMATCVTPGNSNDLWIGTQNFALNCLRDGKFRTYGTADRLASHMIHALFLARNGDLWIGGNAPESLQRFRGGEFKNFPLPRGVGFIRALAEDADGNIWAGSTKGTLLSVRGDELQDAGTQLGSSNSVRCLLAAADGGMWIGYAGWGLGRVKNGKLAMVTSDRGLADDYVSQLISDGKGWIWFGSDHGIFKVRERELNAAMDSTNARVQSVRYGRGEGLPSLQANYDEFPNAWRSRDGKLLLPMSSGLAVANPGQLRNNFSVPPVLINGVLLDDTPVASYGGALPAAVGVDLQNPSAILRLLPGHHRLEFDFAAMSLSAPENAAIEYRLHGADNGWIDARGRHDAIYSRLGQGNYRFEVRARNTEGVSHVDSAVLAFSVAPFFWQTLWFEISTIILFTLLVIALVRYVSFRRLQTKVRLLEQQALLDKERGRIARDIHDHLGGTLTQMKLQLELALRNGAKPEKIEGHVQKSLSAARDAIQSLDETVWAVNPNNDTLPHLVNYIGEYAVGFLDTAGIRCRLDLPEQLPPQAVSTETRHHLFLAIKEGLNNVVRHANASEVKLCAKVNNGTLKFTLEDNGHGLRPASGNSAADGLRNLRQRMEEIGGEFKLESQSAGTRLSFTCPWRAE
jgi:ligand-binding sensor domain-containing protein/signal transduction histidine kinase